MGRFFYPVRQLVTLITLLGVVGCVPAAAPVAATLPAPASGQATTTAIPIIDPSPTRAPASASRTVTPTPTGTTAITAITRHCVANSATLDETTPIPVGRLFFTRRQKQELWVTSDTIANAHKLFSIENTVLSFSPTQSYLAITRQASGRLVSFAVLRTADLSQQEYPWPDGLPADPWRSVSWSGDRLLSLIAEGEAYLISPSTGSLLSTVNFREFIPEVYGGYSDLRSDIGLATYRDHDNNFLMRDIKTGAIITQRNVAMDIISLPVWAPKADRIVFAAFDPNDASFRTNELFVIDTQGQGGRVTNLSQAFRELQPQSFTWSPDQRLIAMWAQAAAPEEDLVDDVWALYVLDLAANTLIDYCFPVKISGHTWTSFDIVWSPDSRFLYVEPHGDAFPQLIDIQSGRAIVLSSPINVFAWSP